MCPTNTEKQPQSESTAQDNQKEVLRKKEEWLGSEEGQNALLSAFKKINKIGVVTRADLEKAETFLS